MRSICSSAVVVSVCALTLALVAPVARGQTFSNSAAINMPTSISDGRATLYPSPIVVGGAPSSIGYVRVTLNGLSHSYVSDIQVLLVSPTGQKILLMAGTNGQGDAVNDTLNFIPDGLAVLPSGSFDVVSGVYACSVYNPSDFLPSPAPGGPYGASLAPLIGTNANGTWNLYVWDGVPFFDNGSIAGGWSISFANVSPTEPMPTAMTYQGVLAAGGTPINGNANVRFTLCNSATLSTAISAMAAPVTRSLTGIQNGLVTTTLDFGPAIDAAQARWLNIEVESPPGSGYVTLSPRTAITPTPQARVAQLAATATSVPWTGITGVPANVGGAFSPWVDGTGTTIHYNAGAVGIGTASPATSLHVAAAASVPVTFESSSTVGTWLNIFNTTTGGRYWRLISTGSANGEGAGNLLIGHGTNLGVQSTAVTILSSNGNVGIGTTTPSQRLTVNGNVLANNVGVPSSGRFKHNVLPMENALEKLLKLEGVTFDWNADFAKDRPGREHDIGFVAEDVAKVFPEVVFFDADGKVTGMDYSRLTAVAVAAIKQQQAKHEAENAELRARIDRLEAALLKLTTSK